MWTIVHYLHPKEPSHMTLDCQHSSFLQRPGHRNCYLSRVRRACVHVSDQGSQTILEICRGHVHRKRRLSISIGGEGLILSQYNNLVLRPLSIRAIDHTASE